MTIRQMIMKLENILIELEDKYNDDSVDANVLIIGDHGQICNGISVSRETLKLDDGDKITSFNTVHESQIEAAYITYKH